jgi:hypothetical protein
VADHMQCSNGNLHWDISFLVVQDREFDSLVSFMGVKKKILL